MGHVRRQRGFSAATAARTWGLRGSAPLGPEKWIPTRTCRGSGLMFRAISGQSCPRPAPRGQLVAILLGSAKATAYPGPYGKGR